MSAVASRELRNQTRALLDRVAAGEQITITIDGRPVADLVPIDGRKKWLPRDAFTTLVLEHQADSGLASDLKRLSGDESTDDLW